MVMWTLRTSHPQSADATELGMGWAIIIDADSNDL
jgi:hypothetical protein